MTLSVIFDNFFKSGGGLQILARWGHVLVGIAWIGLLYFFNFVQTPAYAELSPQARNEAFDKLTWRALWWFRWAAMATFLLGFLMLAIYAMADTPAGTDNYINPTSVSGASILTGILFGMTMLGNVWMVIWPNQQIVIGSVRQQLAGGEADPRQPGAAKKGARASRANTFFSITMLWFMVFTSHFAPNYAIVGKLQNIGIYWVMVLLLWAFVEANALGLVGGLDSPFNKAVFDNHKNTIIYGFVYWAVIFFVGWEILLKNV
ncbi:MAG: hypothetical protein QOC92_4090 [Acidimicrobiaceae bacterium]|jgi:uncharacterized membrane protein